MKLEDIGFYTLSDKRAKTASIESPLMRGELLLTDRCNLKCPYCRGLKCGLRGNLPFHYVNGIVQHWALHGLENIRFSGGEPTLYDGLSSLVKRSKDCGIKRIAVSTNGTNQPSFYKNLIDAGVNDFSISLDSGCCALGKTMTGGNENAWVKASRSIQELSKLTYVTVGVVFNELNAMEAMQTIKYIDSLNPSDIRILSSAQYNKALYQLTLLPEELLKKYPILKYRINNFKRNRNVRGIKNTDCRKCHLVKDDLAVAGKYHFPCIIYLREGGKPIGETGGSFRQQRNEWFKKHDTHKDPICAKNCLDVCVDYNNKCHEYSRTK